MDLKLLAKFHQRMPDPAIGVGDGRELVGRDQTRTFAIGVLANASGEVVAYVSDGKTIGAWFTGVVKKNRVKATGPGKDTLELVIEENGAKGRGTLAGNSLTFSLEPARDGA